MTDDHRDERPTLLSGPKLRKRWGGMSNSTFYDRLKKGRIPAPTYPFGPGTAPYWGLEVIEAFERNAEAQQAQGNPRRGRTAREAA